MTEKNGLEVASSAFNFRDIAPMRIAELAELQSGCFFRSACPETTSVDDFVAKVVTHGIKTIVDLRSTDESKYSDTHLAAISGVRILKIPFLVAIRKEWVNPKEKDPQSTARRYLEMIEAGSVSVLRIFRLIAREDSSPILIHCAAGRDRTGMVYALILATLGIERESIAMDYAKSNDAVKDGYGAEADTILELFLLIERKYGSMNGLLEKIGISGKILRRVKALYRREIA